MTEYHRHNRGQDWITCPECGSDEAGMIHWIADAEITLVCPDCEQKEWDVQGTGEEIEERFYG